MKKFYSLVALAAMTVAVNAQVNAFSGADFENWTDFTSVLSQHGLKSYATQGVGKGYEGTNSLNITTTTTRNDYVFTANAGVGLPTEIKAVTFWVKGTSVSKSLSVNVYKTTLDAKGNQEYYPFNLEVVSDSDVKVEPASNNQYTGSIDTKEKWVKVTLNTEGLSDINLADTTKSIIALKLGKGSDYSLDIDNIQLVDAKLAVYDLAATQKTRLVKNTVVENLLIFGAKAEVTVYNINGQVVKSASVKEGETLDVSALPKGVYVVSGTVNGEKVSQKVIKK